jgi:nitroimidazol reductase NimA-like FMN-containing flavoprotein (pyridoxamine 5'-phosphate oxidase superfamily)
MTGTFKAYPMRRKEKEISNTDEIDAIIGQADICHLGLIDDDEPYVVPVNFGYKKNRIYFHSAREGRKIDVIRNNPKVCFNIVTDIKVVRPSPDSCTTKYKSVTGTGIATIVEDIREKLDGLKSIMRQTIGCEYALSREKVDSVLVVRIDIQKITGKQSV